MRTEKLPYQRIIYVCCNQREGGKECCNDTGGSEIRDRLKNAVKEHGLQGGIRVSKSGCLGQCSTGVNIMIHPDNIWLKKVTLTDVNDIITMYIKP